MAGRKPIVLVNGTGKSINNHYCYKHHTRALSRATTLAMEGKHRAIQIWDTRGGKELAFVSRRYNQVIIEVRNERRTQRAIR
jgi:hypothetical protein